MKIFLIFLLLEIVESVKLRRSDEFLNLARKSGYKCEAHEVETEDGYLLTLHRILPTKNSGSLKPNPVFIQHGIIATSGDFVVLGRKKALAFYLADNGYDVWLGNSRGNKYSTNHKYLSTESSEYWNFSWHEIGYYDLPASIDYVLNSTKTSKAFYACHSQGCTALAVFLSTRPEYNDKIIQAHVMSPVIYMTNFRHPLGKLLKSENERGLIDGYSYLNFDLVWNAGALYRNKFCRDTLFGFYCPGLVALFLFVLGPNPSGLELDKNILKILERHVSPKTSVNQLKHYAQLLYNEEFEMFDGNSGSYNNGNSLSPKRYPIEKISTTLYLYHAADDSVVSIKDVSRLMGILKTVKRVKVIPNFNHADFCYSKNALKLVYKDILEALNSYKG